MKIKRAVIKEQSVAFAVMIMESVRQSDVWRLEYRKRRYLEHASEGELNQRICDIVDNSYSYNREGKLTISSDEGGYQWKIRFAHAIEELALRGQHLTPEKIDGAHFDAQRYKSVRRAADLWSRQPYLQQAYMLKYGFTKHIRPMFECGAMRLSPATRYKDPSLNYSIQDTELEFVEQWYGTTISAPEGGDYNIPREKWTPMPIIGNVKSRLRADSDYYTVCFASSYEYRLFDDFGYDACLVIRDPARFIERLRDCLREILPGWRMSYGHVIYRDPCYPIPNDSICFSKHFRYSYQKEFRLIWYPPTNRERLDYIEFKLGVPTDYCDLLVL